jgi:hypothetical protein
MSQPILHVVFSDSAAGLLRRALGSAGRLTDRVLSFSDNLGFGPIDPPDPLERLQWMKRELKVSSEDWAWLPVTTNDFFSVALAESDRIVVWISRRTVLEYSGFLEWVWRLGEKSYDVIDLTDAEAEWRLPDGTIKQGRIVSLALINPDQVRLLDFLGRAASLPPSSIGRYREMWQQLRAENAPLRVIRGDRLRSAPITEFDRLLLSAADQHWRKTGMVIGRAMAGTWDSDGIQTDDLLLGGRVWALVESVRLEAQGNLNDWQHSEVRLAGKLP